MSTASSTNLESNGSRPSPQRLMRACGLVALAVAGCALVASCVIFVDETEYVIVETLGRIVAVYDNPDSATGDRGLHFKLPWPIGTTRRFDRRQQLFDPSGREMFTRDKKNVTITTYVCWKIADANGNEADLTERPVVRFFRGLGGMTIAEARLESLIRATLSTEIGRVELSELLKVADSESGPGAGEGPLTALAAKTLSQVRARGGAENLRDQLGVELIDLRVKRINLPEGNRFAVYERMRTERERIAERYRSAGRAEKTRIESQARRQSEELLARAEADAERIRGEGEAESLRILNRAHAQDPEFYEFQRTLGTYTKILNERTTLILSSTSRLFRLLTDGVPATDREMSPAAAQHRATEAPKAARELRDGGTGKQDAGGGSGATP